MIRLWHRIGVFRTLSVAVLVLGVVGGSFVAAGRQSQQRVDKSALVSPSVRDQQDELRRALVERDRASAASRDAQRDAQAKADAAAAQAAAQAKAADDAAAAAKKKPPSGTPSVSPSASSKSPSIGPIPTSCAGNTGNQAIGCTLMLQAGFGLDQWPCLKNLWAKESGWRTTAKNPAGAYGIPQSNPGYKMGAYGSDWQTNPVPQIKWGLAYIKGKYKNPCGAWGVWQSKGWY